MLRFAIIDACEEEYVTVSSFRRFLGVFVFLTAASFIWAGPAGPLSPEDGDTPNSLSGAPDKKPAAGTSISRKYDNLFPDVVATVNGQPISGRDLEKSIGMELESIGSPEWENLREDYRGNLLYNLVTGLINSKLIYDEAVANGTSVTDAEVQDEYLKVARTFKNDEEMNAFLAGQNINSEKMIENIHQSLVISKYVDGAIRRTVTVTPEEIERYYSDNPDQFRHPDIVRTSHIMIVAGKNQKEDALARQRIDDLMARLGKGEDFAVLAREYSEGPSASQGGDIGYASREMLPEEYAEAAFSLPVGEIKTVKTQEGYFIVKVTGRKKAGKSTLDEAKEQLTEFLINEKTQQELQKKINRLRNQADIEILIPAGVLLEP